MLESLLTTYGYPIVVIGTFLEGETIMILGGVVSHLGYLSLEWVILCGFMGTIAGDQLYFFLGRRHGKAVLSRRPAWHARADRVLLKLEKHQTLLILGSRYLYGLRTVTPFVIGMSNVPWARFTFLNIIGAGVWATCFGSLGYVFGRAVEAVLGDIKRYEMELLAGIIIIGAIVWFIHFYRQHRSKRATY
jgi:membrane protein DedA with SNARE-associated domain